MALKTFFIDEKEICPSEITEKLEKNFSPIEDNQCLKGDLYETN